MPIAIILAIPAPKIWGEIHFCPDFINHFPNHDLVEFYEDEEMWHMVFFYGPHQILWLKMKQKRLFSHNKI